MWGATYISYPFQKTLLVQPMFKNYVGNCRVFWRSFNNMKFAWKGTFEALVVKFGGKIGTLYQMLKNAFKKHRLQNRTNVQIKGGEGGQRPFEQCSKKLHFFEMSASLSWQWKLLKQKLYVLIWYSLPTPITNFPSFWGASQYFIFSCFPPLPQWPHLRNGIVKVGKEVIAWHSLNWIRLILRCWGKSSILCQQNSDAL